MLVSRIAASFRDGGASVKVGKGLQTSEGGASLYGGPGGILPQRLRNGIFSILHEIFLKTRNS